MPLLFLLWSLFENSISPSDNDYSFGVTQIRLISRANWNQSNTYVRTLIRECSREPHIPPIWDAEILWFSAREERWLDFSPLVLQIKQKSPNLVGNALHQVPPKVSSCHGNLRLMLESDYRKWYSPRHSWYLWSKSSVDSSSEGCPTPIRRSEKASRRKFSLSVCGIPLIETNRFVVSDRKKHRTWKW